MDALCGSEVLFCPSATKRNSKNRFYMTCVLLASHKVKFAYTKDIPAMNTIKAASTAQSTIW